MSVVKTQLGSSSGVEVKLGIAGKTVSTVSTFRHGSTEVIDILCTDSNHYYIKTSQGNVDVGGTPDWGTGTLIGGR